MSRQGFSPTSPAVRGRQPHSSTLTQGFWHSPGVAAPRDCCHRLSNGSAPGLSDSDVLGTAAAPGPSLWGEGKGRLRSQCCSSAGCAVATAAGLVHPGLCPWWVKSCGLLPPPCAEMVLAEVCEKTASSPAAANLLWQLRGCCLFRQIQLETRIARGQGKRAALSGAIESVRSRAKEWKVIKRRLNT